MRITLHPVDFWANHFIWIFLFLRKTFAVLHVQQSISPLWTRCDANESTYTNMTRTRARAWHKTNTATSIRYTDPKQHDAPCDDSVGGSATAATTSHGKYSAWTRHMMNLSSLRSHCIRLPTFRLNPLTGCIQRCKGFLINIVWLQAKSRCVKQKIWKYYSKQRKV